jgi:hypothetical protein
LPEKTFGKKVQKYGTVYNIHIIRKLQAIFVGQASITVKQGIFDM